jgi:hypothetical protein
MDEFGTCSIVFLHRSCMISYSMTVYSSGDLTRLFVATGLDTTAGG